MYSSKSANSSCDFILLFSQGKLQKAKTIQDTCKKQEKVICHCKSSKDVNITHSDFLSECVADALSHIPLHLSPKVSFVSLGSAKTVPR